MIDYYEKMDYNYPEMCITIEKFNILEPGLVKFYIPALMPFIVKDKPKLRRLRPTKSHLLNKETDSYEEDIEISNTCKLANFIEMDLPKWIVSVIKDYKQVIKKQDIVMARLNDTRLGTGGMFPDLSHDFYGDIFMSPGDIYYDKNTDTEIKGIGQLPSRKVDTTVTYRDGKKMYIDEKDFVTPEDIINGININVNIGRMNTSNMVPLIPLISKFGNSYRFNMTFDQMDDLPEDPEVVDPDPEEPEIDPETGWPIDPETGWPIDPETGVPVEPAPEPDPDEGEIPDKDPEDESEIQPDPEPENPDSDEGYDEPDDYIPPQEDDEYLTDNHTMSIDGYPKREPTLIGNGGIGGGIIGGIGGGLYGGFCYSRGYTIPAIPLLDVLEREYFYEIDVYNMVDEGKEFVIAFIGGDIKNKKIIGRYS